MRRDQMKEGVQNEVGSNEEDLDEGAPKEKNARMEERKI